MRYITDIHALNLPCSLGTTGDWHRFAIQWEHPCTLDSDELPWGTWGIEIDSDVSVPQDSATHHNIANHVRAIADMIARRRFTLAQGACEDYLDGHDYDAEISQHIAMLEGIDGWDEINAFMVAEFGSAWAAAAAGKQDAIY